MTRVAAIILVLSFCLAASPVLAEEPPPGVKPATYQDPVGLFSIQYPAGWAVEEDGRTVPMIVRIAADAAADATAVRIMVEAAPGATVDGLFEAFAEGGAAYKWYAQTYKEYRVESLAFTTVDGVRSLQQVYTGLLSETPVKRVEYYVLKDGRAYTITATSTPSGFEADGPLFDWIVSTFKLLQ
jgi:hypothetical protein